MSSRGKRGSWWSWDGHNYTFNKPPRDGCFKSVKKTSGLILITVIAAHELASALAKLL